MRKSFVIAGCLLLPMLLTAQHALFDSVENVLRQVPVAGKAAFFREAQQSILRFPDPEQQNFRAYLLRNSARNIGDSVSLKYANYLLASVYGKRGEREEAAAFRREGKEVAGQFGWNVGEGFRDQHPYYGYAYSRLYDEIMIAEGAKPGALADSVFVDSLHSLFGYNTSRESGWDPQRSYWVKLNVQSSSVEDSVFFLAPGYGFTSDHYLMSWDTVEVFIRYDDGSVEELISGTAIRPGEKDVRDAFNFIRLPLAYGERATLFLRLTGAGLPLPGQGIFLEFVDPATLVELEGYRPAAGFTPKGFSYGEQFSFLPVWRSLEVLNDSLGALSFVDAKTIWESLGHFQGPGPVDWDHVFWVRLRLLGNGEKAVPLLFELPPDRDWAYIDVFWPEDRPGYYVQRQLGQRLPIGRRFLPHWRSLVQYHLGARDTVDLYLRLEGYLGDRSAGRIELRRIDEGEFWPQMPRRALFDGFIMGALLITLAYFLLRSWLVWDRGQLFFALFILGIFLTYAFWLPWDRGAILFPALRPWFDYFLIAGQFLILSGLVSFASVRLNLSAYYPKAGNLIFAFLGLWFLVNLLRAFLYGGLLPPAAFGWLATAYWIVALAGLILLAALAWMTAGKGHTPAYFFLIALFLLAVCSILLTAYWIVEQGWPADQPVVYILEAGIVFALLFLALGAGFPKSDPGKEEGPVN